ncbi:MAG TPA: PAS domain-containing protein [Cytophagaceae bacterium]
MSYQNAYNWEHENSKLRKELDHLKSKLAELENNFNQNIENINNAVLNSLPALIFWKDRQNHFNSLNLQNANLPEFFKEELEEKIEKISSDEEDILSGRTLRSETIFAIDHSWVHTIKVPILNEQKEIVGLAGISNPINLPEQTDELIRSREQIINEILITTPDIIMIYDLDNNTPVYINRSDELFGHAIEDVFAMRHQYLQNIIHPEDLPSLIERNKQLKHASDTDIFEREYRVKNDDGWRWIQSRSKVFKRKDDSPLQVLTIATDITEKKTASEKLRKSEERYRRLVTTTTDIITMLSPDGIILEITPSSEKILGYKQEEVIGKRFFDFYHPEDIQHITDAFNKVGLPEQSRNIIGRIRKKTGEYVWLNNSATAIFNKNHEITEIYTSSTDITNEVEVESKLKEAQHFAQQIADYTPDTIQIYDLETQKNIYLNRQAKINSGWDNNKLLELGSNLYEKIVHPEDLPNVIKRIEDIKSLKDGEVLETEFRARLIDGGYRWAHSRATVFRRNEEGKVKQFISLLRDITEEKIAKEKLIKLNAELESRIALATREIKKSEEKYKVLSEVIPILVWTTDEQGKAIFFNNNWYKYTGQKPEDALGEGWIKALHPEDVAAMIAEKEKAIKNHQMFNLEYRIRRSDGAYRWHVARAVSFDDGDTIKWFGTSTDIHDKKLAEKELVKKNEQLIKINNDLDNFIYTASHDLKAPILNIEGLLQTAKELSDIFPHSEDLHVILKLMQTSVDRFKNTLYELTEISKVQKNITEDIEEINLRKLVEEIHDTLSGPLLDSSGKLDISIANDLTINFSRKNLRSIIYNLISNAIKYRHPQRSPRIKVSGKERDNYIIFSVTDNGLGLKPEYKSKIFSMFKRFHSHVEGTGVGLYIVKRIIDNSGGKIEVQSQPGEGTTFNVYLPKKNGG